MSRIAVPLIRKAQLSDCADLTALMHRSSAYQGKYARILVGYGVGPDQIKSDIVYLAAQTGAAVGFYSLVPGPQPELDLMFVDDDFRGSGLGARLFNHMRHTAAAAGIERMEIVSHPPALGFYQRMGAVQVGVKPSSFNATWERPILELYTSQDS